MPQYQGEWTLQTQAQAQSNQQWVTDPSFKNTTLLLQADGSFNGAQNNTFYDSSTNNFYINRFGNTTQGSFSPFSQAPGYWSNYFSGASYLNIASNAAFALPGAFTIEFFIYFNTFEAANRLIAGATTSGGFALYTNGTTICPNLIGTGNIFVPTFTPVVGQWYHIAVSRDASNNMRMWVNGSSVGSTTIATSYAQTAYQINDSAGSMAFYMSNLREVKGSVIYDPTQTTINVPTGPLSAVTNTQLLTCQNNRFLDNSTNAFTFTTSGTPSVQAFSLFFNPQQWTPDIIGGSGYFDGTGDYLQTPSNAIFAMGTGQFCLEAWHYPTGSSGNILSSRTGPVNDAAAIDMEQITATAYSMYANGDHVRTTMTPYQWNHIVITRDASNTLRLILNGVLGNYETSYTANITNTTVAVGALVGGSQPLFGYMGGVRIIKGSIPTTYQTSSTTNGTVIYSVPTSPITTSSQGNTAANVSLLLSYTNAAIYDGTMKNNLETVNTAQVSTTTVKYGSGSIKFNGSTDYLSAASSQNLTLGTGDFTIEAWIYPINWTNADATIIGGNQATNSPRLARYSTNNNLGFVADGVGWIITDATLPPLSTWSHVAVTRSNNNFKIFVNGVQSGSTAASTQNFSVPLLSVGVANTGAGAPGYFTGYIDDLRVTKGVCRYFTTFTPPQQALPRQ